jgi:SPP1 family predicted phage head-tail adaptor
VIAAGDLDKRISWQRRVEDRADDGQVVGAWVEVQKLWAKVEAVTAGERRNASAVGHQITHRVVLRYQPDFRPEDRIVYRDRVFDVTGVRDIEERRIALEITCVEGLQ